MLCPKTNVSFSLYFFFQDLDFGSLSVRLIFGTCLFILLSLAFSDLLLLVLTFQKLFTFTGENRSEQPLAWACSKWLVWEGRKQDGDIVPVVGALGQVTACLFWVSNTTPHISCLRYILFSLRIEKTSVAEKFNQKFIH